MKILRTLLQGIFGEGKKPLLLCLLGIMCLSARAQIVSVQTNALDYVSLGTLNLESGIALSRHLSVMAGGRYNPWTFTQTNPDCTIENRQATAYLGLRYWTWYVNSGWWFAAKAQYQDFTNTGIWRAALQEGKGGIGGGLSLGYTYMLAKHVNIEFGLGAWVVHYREYNFYDSPRKYSVRHEGSATKVYPDNPSISFVYVF